MGLEESQSDKRLKQIRNLCVCEIKNRSKNPR